MRGGLEGGLQWLCPQGLEWRTPSPQCPAHACLARWPALQPSTLGPGEAGLPEGTLHGASPPVTQGTAVAWAPHSLSFCSLGKAACDFGAPQGHGHSGQAQATEQVDEGTEEHQEPEKETQGLRPFPALSCCLLW